MTGSAARALHISKAGGDIATHKMGLQFEAKLESCTDACVKHRLGRE